ncbi:MAG: YihY/virulence factor BrkB family protein [Proteobacteria bacterium]|nr:YihY/virulence factor BrkB family protein [Pseudomonadota bacterium]
MSLSSGPAPAEDAKKPSIREAAKMAPWLAMVALAALWPRRKKPGEAEPEPPLTPEDFAAAEPGRGRDAEAPWEIPALGWKDILWRTYRETGKDRVGALSGGVTFFVLLATFPALAAFVSLYGLFSDVGTVETQLEHMSAVFPRDAVTLIGRQMLRLATTRPATASAAFVASTLASVWSANAGMKALFDGLNIAYGEEEKRDYLRRTLMTYGATFSALAFLAAVAAILVGAPVLLRDMGIESFGVWWRPLRWVVVYLIAAAGFTLLYRFGPSRMPAAWRWVVGGGAVAALFWMAGSLGFSWYVNNFTHFGVTYGSLGAAVAFMLWVWFSVNVLLTGAVLNSEIEHQTACDTTAKPHPRPMGQRGATVADNLGKAFTVSPREAVDYTISFAGRQVGYVANFLRRAVGML